MKALPAWDTTEFIARIFNLDRSGFAFEFLRRNLDYQGDYLKVSDESTASVPSSFVSKWGLTFPG